MNKPLLRVSVDEFLARESPTGRRSILAPFADDVERLVKHGYSLDQVAKWLGQNGVNVTPSAISQFRGRRAQRVDSSARNSGGRRLASLRLDADESRQTQAPEKSQATGTKPEEAAEGLRRATERMRNVEKGIDLSGYKPTD